MIESEYSPYSEDEFEGESEDEGVERSPKEDHHSSGHHSLSRSPDVQSGNSLTANPSTPSTTSNARRVRMKRTSRNSSNKAAKARPAAMKAAKRPQTPTARVSARKHKARVHQFDAMSEKSRHSPKITPKRTATIISVAEPSPLERVILAKQETITELSDRLVIKDSEVKELRKENKLLRTVQFRQGKALDRFQNAEAELPQLVNRHTLEMAGLKQRLRKSQNRLMATEHKMREQNEEVWKLKVMLNEVTKLSGDKHLLERDRLRQMLNKTNEKLDEKTKRVVDLEKHVELQGKTHNREVKDLKLKYKQAVQEAEKWQEQYETVFFQLKEKLKELEIKNIYSQRIIRNTPRTLPPVAHASTSTQDVAVNTETLTIGDVRPPTDMTSGTSVSLTESTTSVLPDKQSPSPTHSLPRPPSQPRPLNMPRRNSPRLFSSSTVRDSAMSNGEEHTMKENVSSLATHELGNSESLSRPVGSQVNEHEQPFERALTSLPQGVFVTQNGSKAEVAVGPQLTSQNENGEEPDAAALAAAAEERRKKDLLLAKLRAMDEEEASDNSTNQQTLQIVRDHPTVATSSGDVLAAKETSPDMNGIGDILKHDQSSSQFVLSSDVVRDSAAVDVVTKPEQASDQASMISKSSSQYSWSNRVENLHSGRPALSTDEDYYGAHSTSAGRRATSDRIKARETNHSRENSDAASLETHSSGEHRESSGKSLTRRHKPPLTENLTKLAVNGEMPPPADKPVDDLEETTGYQPSFLEPKAAAPIDSPPVKKLPLKFNKKKPYPWETSIPVFPQRKVGSEQAEAGKSNNKSLDFLSSEPLLPRRERQIPTSIITHDTVNDDDIEEVVL